MTSSTLTEPSVLTLTCHIERKEPLDRNTDQERREQTADFEVLLIDQEAIFTFRRHIVSWDEAVELVQPYIWAWEIVNDLDFPGAFRVRPMLANIRQPDGTIIQHNPAKVTFSQSSRMIAYGSLDRYPLFPTGIEWSELLELMRDRYVRYVKDREPVASMGYFCLTVLESWALADPVGRKASSARSKRGRAAHRYSIDAAILDKLGELCSARGGQEARKIGGVSHPLTEMEEIWIRDTIKKVIRRFGEVAVNPINQRTLPQITMSDLPPLP